MITIWVLFLSYVTKGCEMKRRLQWLIDLVFHGTSLKIIRFSLEVSRINRNPSDLLKWISEKRIMFGIANACYDMFSNDPSPRKGGPFYKTRNTRACLWWTSVYVFYRLIFVFISKFRFLFFILWLFYYFFTGLFGTVSANWRIVCNSFALPWR